MRGRSPAIADASRPMKLPDSERIRFEAFVESDAEQLAGLLADSSITRNITTNGSTPERCLASARRRIARHNGYFESTGYRVWALRARSKDLAPADRLLGWCGFVPPDDDDPDPEILYAIDHRYRGMGLASEAAARSISWLFEYTDYPGVTAVIHSRLNPGSVAVVSKLGLRYRKRMEFSLFLTSAGLADEVAEYEIWRLARGPAANLDELIEQAAFRAGQLSTVTAMPPAQILQGLGESLTERCAAMPGESGLADMRTAVEQAFERGAADAWMDCYHVSREQWLAADADAKGIAPPATAGES